MTDEQLAAIRARCDAATPGPWVARLVYNAVYGAEAEGVRSEPDGTMICGPGFPHPGAEDAEFIAAARADVPALLEEISRLREEVSVLRDLLVDAVLPGLLADAE